MTAPKKDSITTSMTSYEKFLEDLRRVATKRYGTPSKMADEVGFSQPIVSNLLRKKSRPRIDTICELLDKLGATIQFPDLSPVPINSIDGNGPSGEGAIVDPEIAIPESAGSVFPVYQFAAGGFPVSLAEAEPICEVCIPKKFTFPGLMVVQVMGDSMAPLIRDGAYIGINKEGSKLIPGRVYAVNVPYEGLTIKRVFLDTANGELILKPENPTHPETRVPIDNRDGLIVGEVVWEMQNMN